MFPAWDSLLESLPKLPFPFCGVAIPSLFEPCTRVRLDEPKKCQSFGHVKRGRFGLGRGYDVAAAKSDKVTKDC